MSAATTEAGATRRAGACAAPPQLSADGAALEVVDLSVGYYQKDGSVLRVAANVDLKLFPGQVLGLAGESGCGKTTAALAAVGYRHPGGVILSGRSMLGETDLLKMAPSALRLLWGGQVAYISQNAASALNPAMTIKRHFDEVLKRHAGMHGSDAAVRELELLTAVQLPDPAGSLLRYPHQLSGGQQQRVALAIAFACRPAVLILDEPTTGLDVTTQTYITALLQTLIEETQVAVMYVSHDLALLSTVSNDVAVMYAGEMVERGPVQAMVKTPLHPYTNALLRAVPSARARQSIAGIAGEPPVSVCDDACSFAPRCPHVEDRCRSEHPEMVQIEPLRTSRCFRTVELREELRIVVDIDRTPSSAAARADQTQAAHLLEVDDVSCFYGSRRRRFAAVQDVSFSLSDAEVLGIVGLSGSGKSTLLRAIVGILDDYTGTISLRGESLAHSAVKRPRPVRRQVQIVFQDPASSLNPRHTVNQIIARAVHLFREDVSRDKTADTVAELLESVKLSRSFLSRYPSELSGGQQQRVAIARAFAARPSLLLCDEVTSALDVSVAATIIELLRDLTSKSGTAVLFVSHDLAVVRTLADRAIVMRDGKVCEAGSTEQLFCAPQHPYTIELLSSIPDIADVRAGRRLQPGDAPVC
jgi:peptide/nickel transport system ATP-binding protein